MLVTEEGAQPRFNRGRRPHLPRVDSEGGARGADQREPHRRRSRVHLTSENATQFVPSPDERYVAWVERFNAYVAPLPLTGSAVEIGPTTTRLSGAPRSRATPGSTCTGRADAAARLLVARAGAVPARSGGDLRVRGQARREAPRASGERGHADRRSASRRRRPDGTLALIGATVITMNGDEVIQNATVVIDGNRIVAVGPSAAVHVPAGARRIDVARQVHHAGHRRRARAHRTGSSGIAPQHATGGSSPTSPSA